MLEYENVPHGTMDFPVGIHDTKYADGFRLYPHIHRELELLVLTKGCGTMYIDGKEYYLKEGDGVFVNSCQLHLGVRANDEPCEFFAVVFAPEFIGGLGGDAIAEKYVFPVINKKISLPTFLSRETQWQRQILDLTCDIHDFNLVGLPLSELSIKAKLLEIWRLMFLNGEQSATTTNSGIEKVKTAMEYIRAEFSSPLTLNDMARKSNLNRDYFCRLFSSVMHMTPFTYLLRVRIDNACRLLRDKKLPVSEVAESCGFNSFSYFSKKFKEVMGCTPAEYGNKFKTTLLDSGTGP